MLSNKISLFKDCYVSSGDSTVWAREVLFRRVLCQIEKAACVSLLNLLSNVLLRREEAVACIVNHVLPGGFMSSLSTWLQILLRLISLHAFAFGLV